MAEQIPISVYCIPPRTPEQIKDDQNELYVYIEALIKAEKLNPEDDWEGVRATKLLRKIAQSGLREEQRKGLVALLDYSNDEDDEE